MLCSPALLGAAAGAAELAWLRAEGLGHSSWEMGQEMGQLLQPWPQQSGAVLEVQQGWPCYTARGDRGAAESESQSWHH